MSVPKIFRIKVAGRGTEEPVEGPTMGGTLVEIYGDNFRLPEEVKASGTDDIVDSISWRAAQETVSVKFGDNNSPHVRVIRSNLIHAIAPASPISVDRDNYYGAGKVDVTVQNLDDNEDPIAGESVTKTNSYTYRRPLYDDFSASSGIIVRLVRKIILDWKRGILPNTSFTTHMDYDPNTATPIIETADLPSIIILLTDTPENRFYARNDRKANRLTSNLVEVQKGIRTVDLEFDVFGISDSVKELLAMLQASNTYMHRNPFIHLPVDQTDASKGEVKYELDFLNAGGFQVQNRPNTSNIHFFSGSIVIRGVDIELLPGFFGDHIRYITTTLKEDPKIGIVPEES